MDHHIIQNLLVSTVRAYSFPSLTGAISPSTSREVHSRYSWSQASGRQRVQWGFAGQARLPLSSHAPAEPALQNHPSLLLPDSSSRDGGTESMMLFINTPKNLSSLTAGCFYSPDWPGSIFFSVLKTVPSVCVG